MGLFSKKADPITSKAKAIENQIAALELEIRQLNRRLDKPQPPPQQTTTTREIPHPTVRSTATPHAPRTPAVSREPIFESVEQAIPAGQTENSSAHYNELGVRKYDLAAAWRRILNYLRGPGAHNPKLVSYLAAGSIRGLRPLRYEKRIARNRFMVMSLFFLVVLWVLISLYWRHR